MRLWKRNEPDIGYPILDFSSLILDLVSSIWKQFVYLSITKTTKS